MLSSPNSRPKHPLAEIWHNRVLLLKMAQRDINSKYYGSAFGLIWATATPIVLMGAYWFVLGRMLKGSWPGLLPGQYPLLLFLGIIIHIFFSEIVGRAPHLIESHKTYVKKVVFPLGILSGITVLSACFHLVISLGILAAAQLVLLHALPTAWLALPIILVPLALMCLGLSWILSALSVYIRDLQQVIPLLITVSMFLSPIFFPTSNLPENVQFAFMLNPITLPVEMSRDAVLNDVWPDPMHLSVYWVAALSVLVAGSYWFRFSKRGFADVI